MTNVPAGWYPDPAGSSLQRWWDGSNWSQTTQPAPQQSNPYASASPYGTVEPYTPMGSYTAASGQGQSYYSTAQLGAPAGTDPSTPQAWIIAFWPLLGLVSAGIGLTIGLYGSPGDYTTNVVGLTQVDLLSYGISFVVWLAFILVAYLDYRELQRRQVQRPFHWAFAIIPWPIVYVIGRAVTVYSRTRRGLAPLFVWIGASVLNIVILIVLAVAAVTPYL